jgi:hypothetical protein
MEILAKAFGNLLVFVSYCFDRTVGPGTFLCDANGNCFAAGSISVKTTTHSS